MEDLNELARQEIGAELKSAMKKTLITVLVIVGGIALLIGVFYLINFIKWGFFL